MSLLVTTNLLWFVLASAVELGLAGYLLWRWATTPERSVALLRFYQFQGTGLLLLFAGTLMLAWHYADTAGHWSFELTELTQVSYHGSLATLIARSNRLQLLLVLLGPARIILDPWCRTPSITSGGGAGTLAAKSRRNSISGNGGGRTPRSTAISTCSEGS